MFETRFKVDYLFTKQDLSTSLLRMMYYVQETSLLHSEEVGLSMQWYTDNKTGFVLTGWNVVVHKLPKWGEEIISCTWANNIKKMLADRSFVIKDINGNVLIEAQSNWIYLDLVTFKPIIVSDEIKEMYGSSKESVLDHRFRIEKLNDYKFEKSFNYKVRNSDIDSNNHMNNISYLMLMIEALNEQEKNIKAFKVKYAKQSIAGEDLKIDVYNKDKKYIINILKEEETRCTIEVTIK